jgi:hypothetical protein
LGREREMNLNRQLRISKKVWLGISIPLFIAAWFLRGGKGGDEPAWEIWRVFLTHDYICSDGEMLMGLGIYTLAFALPALLAGWLLQFPVCMTLDYFRRGSSKHENDMAQPEH